MALLAGDQQPHVTGTLAALRNRNVRGEIALRQIEARDGLGRGAVSVGASVAGVVGAGAAAGVAAGVVPLSLIMRFKRPELLDVL